MTSGNTCFWGLSQPLPASCGGGFFAPKCMQLATTWCPGHGNALGTCIWVQGCLPAIQVSVTKLNDLRHLVFLGTQAPLAGVMRGWVFRPQMHAAGHHMVPRAWQRSEERRVGKEWTARYPGHSNKDQ